MPKTILMAVVIPDDEVKAFDALPPKPKAASVYGRLTDKEALATAAKTLTPPVPKGAAN
jgi:hypothetical protein